MAKKVQPVDILPAPSSSDDETEDQDGSSSETDDEQHPPQSQKPLNQEPQESDDDSDDETEDDQPVPKLDLVVKKPSLQEPTHESEESDDDDSDETQNSPSASAFTVKPIVSKLVSKSPEPKTLASRPARVKSRAKRPADSEETDKAVKAGLKNQEPGKVKGGNGKRPAEVEKVSKSKKSKGLNGEGQSVGKVEKGSKSKKGANGDDGNGEDEEKKSLVKWSEKDEVVLLSGIIDYKAETGEDVNSKVDTFYEYVKDLLSVTLTKSQLYEKIKRLKKKFQTNVEKGKNGEEPVFSRPHENKLFELSQKIWGSDGAATEGNDGKVKSSKKKDKNEGNVARNTSTPSKPDTGRELLAQEEVKDVIMEEKKEETKDFWSLYPRLCASLETEASRYLTQRVGDFKEYVKGIISGMGEEKARELEDEWKAIYVMDHQLYAKRAHLISKQAEAVSDSLNYS